MSDENETKKDIAYFETQGKMPSGPIEWLAKVYEIYYLKGQRRMFKSGFAWIKPGDGYSYICKIVDRNEDDTLFTVEIGDVTFTDVPVTALQPMRGDE